MSVSVNWQPIVGGFIVAVGFVVAVVFAVQWWRNRPQTARMDAIKPDPKLQADARKADELPPAGSVPWVLDIVKAMGSAKAESVLDCLKKGATRDQARMARIAELESKSESKA